MPQSAIIKLERLFNVLELGGIIIALFMAFGFQIILHELPCPLCLLQRIGLLGIALGFLLNLRFGLRPSHYAIVLLSALFTSFVALRQVALHVIPGTGSYGDAIFGMHLYTWSFIISMLILVVTTLMMSVDRQYQNAPAQSSSLYRSFVHLLFGVMILLALSNIISVYLECGLKQCPDNPVVYKLG